MSAQGRGAVAVARKKREAEEAAARQAEFDAEMARASQPDSSPSPSGSNVPVDASTPAAQPSINTQGAGGDVQSVGGGGGAPDLTKDRGSSTSMMPEDVEGAVEKSAAHVANAIDNTTMARPGALAGDPEFAKANAADKKVQINEQLAAQGANPRKALESLRDERLARYKQLAEQGAIEKKTYTKLKDRWKNIFNIIPEEDFGMVLMDFGFRAMMAGESMGSMGALGAAGAGALAGVQQRRDQAYERGIEQMTMAEEGARADLDAITKAEAEGKKLPDTYNTTEGMFTRDENGDLVAVRSPETGAILRRDSTDRRSVKAYEVEEWKSRFPGMTDQDVWLATASGLTPQQAYDRAQSRYNSWANSPSTTKRSTLRIPGKGDVRKDELTDTDIENWKRQQVINFGYSEGALPKAVPGGEQSGGYEWRTEKPDNWSNDQWDQYVAKRKEATGE